MDPIDYWKLCTEFSIVQAALLICGRCPDDLQYEVENNLHKRPDGYVGTRTALQNAVQTKSLSAVVVVNEHSDFSESSTPNIHETLIRGYDVNLFLKSKNMTSEFFETYSAVEVSPLDGSQQLPIKLNAANKAWSAVTSNPELLRGKSPKQALKKWLTGNAAALGLLNKNGTPNHTGIDEICKVANWKPEGGATPTHASEILPVSAPVIRLPSPSKAKPDFSIDSDEEIPF